MQGNSRITESIGTALRCPVCRSSLVRSEDELACGHEPCSKRFPIVNGVPILINEARSAFAISDFVGGEPTTFRRQPALERIFARFIPEITANTRAPRNYKRFTQLLLERRARPVVLVVGCGELGRGMESLAKERSIQLVNTDVSFGRQTMLICDSHDLPFADGTFDGVIIQAVLEHAADPPRCVEELHRVLADEGLVYAETPFMQQVHGGPFDFTRFTHLGHRRLFRCFDEIASGATAGSALALAWAYQYFLLSLVKGQRARAMMKGIARLSACWLRLVDPWLLDTPGTLDAALGYYFMGRRSDHVLSDRELVRLYRGAGSALPDPADP